MGRRRLHIGVDLFFVLSGFLVSTILYEELAERGRLDLVRFYDRRVRRLQVVAPPPAGVRAAAGTWRRACAGGAGLVVLAGPWLDLSPSWRGIAAMLAALALVGGLSGERVHLAAWPFALAPVVHLGKISYGTSALDAAYYGREFEADLKQAGIELLRKPRKGEPPRPGQRFFKPLRQVIESVNDTLKGQLDHRTPRAGWRRRVSQGTITPLTGESGSPIREFVVPWGSHDQD